jgi:hypothetical protein
MALMALMMLPLSFRLRTDLRRHALPAAPRGQKRPGPRDPVNDDG